MKIAELQLKLQPTTLPEVREHYEAAIKEGMATLDATVTDYVALFEQAIELMTNLQEHSNLQTLNIDVRELQCQYDEFRATVRSLAQTQCLSKLQEGKQLLAQVEDMQNKDALLQAKLQTWLEKAYQVTTIIQDKLKGLQQTHQMMRWAVEGPATEKLAEEVQQVVTQSVVELALIQVELGGVHNKIAVPSE